MKLAYAFVAATLLIATPALAVPRFEKVENTAAQGPVEGDFVMGSAKAPVTIIEYASLTCPHCAHFHRDVMQELEKRYIKTGKVRYVLRQYPLNEPALKAAELVDCVGTEQGNDRYYTFNRVLFEAQEKWAFDSNWQNALLTFAKVGGVNREMYDACTTDTAREKKMLVVKQIATKELGVTHTPYLFIGGHRYDDEPTLERVTAFIDSLLAKQGGKKKGDEKKE